MQTREDLERYPLMKGRGPFDRPRVFTKVTQSLWHFVILAGLLGFESDLTRAYSDGNRQYWMFFIFLTLFSNVLYFTTSLSDPGYIDHNNKQITEDRRIKDLSSKGDDDGSDKNSADLESQTLIDTLPSDFPPLEFCNFCNQTMPLRSRHCNMCGRCVYKWDHHCPFTGNCVGGKNHRYFWCYLVVECSLVLWCLWIMYTTYKDVTWTLRDSYSWPPMIARGFFMVVLALMEAVGLMLLVFHSFLLLNNRTTREVMMSQRYTRPYPEHLIAHLKSKALHPFSRGIFTNIYYVVRGAVHPHYQTSFAAENASSIKEGHQFTKEGFVSRFPHLRRGGRGGHAHGGARRDQCCNNHQPPPPSAQQLGHHQPHQLPQHQPLPQQQQQCCNTTPHYNAPAMSYVDGVPSPTSSGAALNGGGVGVANGFKFPNGDAALNGGLNPHAMGNGHAYSNGGNGHAYANGSNGHAYANGGNHSNGVVHAGQRLSINGAGAGGGTRHNGQDDDIGCVPVDTSLAVERKRVASRHEE